MREIDSMKILEVVGVAVMISLFATMSAFANGAGYMDKVKCVPVCEGKKPYVEYIKDGAALLLDIPLAMLSPVCSGFVKPIMEMVDPARKCGYSKSRRRR